MARPAAARSSLEWRVSIPTVRKVGFFLLHMLGVGTLHYFTFPGRHSWFWVVVIAYYWFFYFRIIRFATWTNSTLDLISRAANSLPLERLKKLLPPARWPRFVLFVPAWGAGQCIALTASILNRLNYPCDLWRVVFVSDEAEQEATRLRSLEVAGDVCDAIARGVQPRSIPVHHAASLLYEADKGRARTIDYVLVLGPRNGAAALAWAGLLGILARRSIFPDDSVPDLARRAIGLMVQEASATGQRFVEHVAALLGIVDPDFALQAGWENWTAAQAPRSVPRQLRRALKGLQQAGSTMALRERMLAGETRHAIARAFRRLNPSTTDALDECLARLRAPNMHHFRRPKGIRNKASALNYALAQSEAKGWLEDQTQVMVLDSDSFVHKEALSLAGIEIARDAEPNVIRQLLPITTTNFQGRNWLVQTIIAADSIAAAGRWARSVRTETRSDLTAGSGVLIPAAFLRYLRRTYGEAWDTSLICEDARMIMSQYAILDGASRKTRMVPAWVLEGAPEQEGVWQTYVAFWKQRLRWAIGGMDEVRALLRVTPAQMRVRGEDFSDEPVTRAGDRAALRRKLQLTAMWLKENLWWSGVAFAPALWLAGEFVCGQPTWGTRCLGAVSFLAFPIILLTHTFARHVSSLVPAGVSKGQLARLIPIFWVMSIPYVLPIVVAQLLCATGIRRRLPKHWNPATPKPGSQCDIGVPSQPR